MTNRILFVDDEAKILQGMRRMMRSQRNVWDMDFANSGDEALEMFRAAPFDVVVSDMRMPGMDGATLLKHVQLLAPEAVRIILSGYSEQEAILRTVGPAHRFLAKPTAAEDLIKTIENALKLRTRLKDTAASQVLHSLKDLPSAPAVYKKLLAAMKSYDGEVDEIVQIIESDPAFAAQTLKLTNSAFFGLPESTTSIARSVQVLGFDTIRAIALESELYHSFDGPQEHLAILQRLGERSMIIGQVARAFARQEALDDATCDMALCAGVVSHVGTLAMLVGAPDMFDQICSDVDQNHNTLIEAETSVFGCDHAQLGAYFLGLWAFSDSIVEAIAYHHAPSTHDAPISNITLLVHAAQALCSNPSADNPNLDLDYITSCGKADRINAWAETARAMCDNNKGEKS